MSYRYIKWFEELSIGDVPLVGGKNASLGEMYRELKSEGIQVPNGFAVTAEAYFETLQSSGVSKEVERLLAELDTSDVNKLARAGKALRKCVYEAELPEALEKELEQAYEQLCSDCGGEDVAVRSSATGEIVRCCPGCIRKGALQPRSSRKRLQKT